MGKKERKKFQTENVVLYITGTWKMSKWVNGWMKK